MVNQHAPVLNGALFAAFDWPRTEITWLSPTEDDHYAEYYDDAFLERLDVQELEMPLEQFWPKSGPRWDGLARTNDGKLILVEAKAYIEEAVDFRSRASPDALRRIEDSLDKAKAAFKASNDACWRTPLYQMANRLAHLYFLAGINNKNAYLVFIDFANAPDVPNPATCLEWQGASRLAHKCLGLTDSPLAKRVATVIVDLKTGSSEPTAYPYCPSRTTRH